MRALLAFALLAVPATCALCAPDAQQAELELQTLCQKVPTFQVVALPDDGELALRPDRSLTIESLRGVPLDDTPPQLGPLIEPYDANRPTTSRRPGAVRRRHRPPLRPLSCEFNYGSWHNMAMHDYAALHGFNIIYPSARGPAQPHVRHEMAALGRLHQLGRVDAQARIAAGRYDLPTATCGELAAEVRPDRRRRLGLSDDRHGARAPAPRGSKKRGYQDGDEQARQAFERKYYHGYALTYTAPMAAAKKLGYRNLSVYGWEPFLRQWWGLDTLQFSPETYWQWMRFGKEIYESNATDILNPSLYVYYWSPQNVASTICNLDYNRELVETMPERKPIRPYYWTLLHGGDASYHWWKDQPVTNEEARAWTLLCLMSGTDGFDLWNWSGTGSHHTPRAFKYKDGEEWKYSDTASGQLRLPGRRRRRGPGAMQFARYDFIHWSASATPPASSASEDDRQLRSQVHITRSPGLRHARRRAQLALAPSPSPSQE